MLLVEKEIIRRKRSSRRGSILILVLGVLALMAVFAAVYLTIGVGDQRAARAVERRQDLDQAGPDVGRYIADIIAKDRLAYAFLPGSNSNGVASVPYREMTDYPYTDYSRVSIPGLAGYSGLDVDRFRFRPEGSHPVAWSGDLRLDPRVFDDPFLASSEPTFLGLPSQRLYPDDPTKWWMDNVDYLQISNVAPDGLFVNLFALRNNFDAEPGIGTGAGGQAQLSRWLSLLERRSDGRLQATLNTPFGGVADLNRPAHWTMYQRNMLFPVGQPFYIFGRNGQIAGWGHEDFPLYQYADTNGDGFADARWFELTDSTVLNRVDSLLPRSGNLRLFIAVRVEDLSGRVNVNTATDDVVAPTTFAPIGSSPAEISLRRVLTMEDAAFEYRSVIAGVVDEPLTYGSGIPRPRVNGGISTDPLSDYSMYDTRAVADAPLSFWVGWYAYDAILRSIQNDQASLPFSAALRGDVTRLDVNEASEVLLPFSLLEYGFLKQGESINVLDDPDLRAMNRKERYETVGRRSPLDPTARNASQTEPSERFGTAIFGVAELGELLVRRGLNDPSMASRLEFAADGRLDDGTNPGNVALARTTTRRLGPLRSTRDLAFEYSGHDDVTGDDVFAATPVAGPDGKIDPDALALLTLSPRGRLTTISGGAELHNLSPLLSSEAVFSTRFDNAEVKSRFSALAGGSLEAIFGVYRRALSPYSNIVASWDAEPSPTYDEYRTLSYGYCGPELAMRAAAHLAVNLKDQYDLDNTPTVATVALTSAPAVINQLDQQTNENRVRWAGWFLGNRMTVPEAYGNPTGGGGTVDANVLNVYGIEAQPFIVEAMSINVFTDAPHISGLVGAPNGDIDYNPDCLRPTPIGQPPAPPVEITIGGQLTAGDAASGNLWDLNSDFTMQVLAVKLHNPFNVPVTLGAPATSDRRGFDYYLEFGGRFFKLARYVAPDVNQATPEYQFQAVTLMPGATRVFYMLAQEDKEKIRARWQRYLNAYNTGVTLSEDAVDAWLQRQFRLDSLAGNQSAVWIRRFDPQTGLMFGVTDENQPIPTDRFEDLWTQPSASEMYRAPDWQVVRLWRKITTDDQEVGPSQTDNWIENDQLMDRLREPNPSVVNPGVLRMGHLDSRLQFRGGYGVGPTGGPRVTGTQGCDQSNAQATARDNTGWTIAPHSFIRRRGFPANNAGRDGTGQERLMRGVLPIWCIESLTTTTADSLNVKGGELPSGTLSDAEIDFGESWAFRRLSTFLASNEPVGEDFNKTPNEWTTNNSAKRTKLNDELYGPVLAPNQARPLGVDYLSPEMHVRNDRFEFDPDGAGPLPAVDISRVTDILSPLAIGPEFDPLADDDRDNDPTLPGRYLTLSEAWSLALGFDWYDPSGTAPVYLEGVQGRYTHFDPAKRKATDPPNGAATGDFEYAFDRGHLWIDKFVAFRDANRNGVFDPAADTRMGVGTPLALRLLDAVQTGVTGTPNQVMQRPMQGKINVNTAPLSTLRTIGMLAPSMAWDALGEPENWVWRLGGEMGLVSPSPYNPTPYVDFARAQLGIPDLSRMDIAATLESYRDRSRQVAYRGPAFPQALLSGFSADPGYGFLPLTQNRIPNPLLIRDNRRDDFGRSLLTRITGIREAPGFAHAGELLAARFGPDSVTYYRELAPMQMDYFGRDVSSGSMPLALKTLERTGGTAPFRVSLESKRYVDFDPFTNTTYNAANAHYSNELGNDYSEQLVIASQVLELVTVRSDYFAVWFVIQGYSREDVSNLGPNDPMVPSLARRYVMVIDRSKVGTWVDSNSDGVRQDSETVLEPEIVLFREVPM